MTSTMPSSTASPSLAELAERCFHENLGTTLERWLLFVWKNRADLYATPGYRGLIIARKSSSDTLHVECYIGPGKNLADLLKMFKHKHPELRFVTYECLGRDKKRNRKPTLRRVLISRGIKLATIFGH